MYANYGSTSETAQPYCTLSRNISTNNVSTVLQRDKSAVRAGGLWYLPGLFFFRVLCIIMSRMKG